MSPAERFADLPHLVLHNVEHPNAERRTITGAELYEWLARVTEMDRDPRAAAPLRKYGRAGGQRFTVLPREEGR